MSNKLINTPVFRSKTIDFKVNQEYILFHDLYKERGLDEDQLDTVYKKLFEKETSQQEKKELLFRLAHTSVGNK